MFSADAESRKEEDCRMDSGNDCGRGRIRTGKNGLRGGCWLGVSMPCRIEHGGSRSGANQGGSGELIAAARKGEHGPGGCRYGGAVNESAGGFDFGLKGGRAHGLKVELA